MSHSMVHTAGVALEELTRSAIRAELTRRGLSQRALARMCGWSQPYLWRRLAGEFPFTTTELEQVAQALDVPVAQFLTSADDAPAEVTS